MYAVTRGSFGFADEEFHKLVKQIFQVARALWKARWFPHYYVTLLPTDDPPGLRDGQKWGSGGFVWDDPTRLTKLTVMEGDTQKVVQFYPAATKAIPLPQYKLKPNLSAEERAQCLSQFGVRDFLQLRHR